MAHAIEKLKAEHAYVQDVEYQDDVYLVVHPSKLSMVYAAVCRLWGEIGLAVNSS